MTLKKLHLAALAFAVLAPCAFAESQPEWMTSVPFSDQRICGIGSSLFGERNEAALTVATQRAKVEVLQALRTTVKNSTDIMASQRSSNDGNQARNEASQFVRQVSNFDSSARELPGLALAESYTDAKEKTVYALACLDTAVASSDVAARIDELERQLPDNDPNAPGKASLGKLNRLNALRSTLSGIQDQKALLGTWLDRGTAERVARVQITLDSLIARYRSEMTFAIEESPPPSLIDASLASALTQQGFIGSDREPRYIVATHPGQQNISTAMGLYVIRQSFEIAVKDSLLGTEGMQQISCKGLGADMPQAQAKLQEQCQKVAADGLSKILKSGY